MKCSDNAICSRWRVHVAILLIGLFAAHVHAKPREKDTRALKEDKQQVHAWNTFAERLYTLHQHLIAQHEIRTQTEQGGYAHQPDIYTETRYYDRQTNHLLSRIQRMNDNPSLIQLIEVNIYNVQGQVARDYLAAYLPYNRNAPIQTLINLHGYHGKLQAFRQFDASDERIYEQCQGEYQGKPVMISLEEDEFGKGPYRASKTVDSTEYKTCFDDIPVTARAYLNPLTEIATTPQPQDVGSLKTVDDYNRRIETYTASLKRDPKNVELLIRRGDLYFHIHEFEQAIADYSDAIDLDKDADAAYFGRGMALGRYGQIREGIADLSIYIQRHPQESRAHTKRGVRYLWIRDEKRAVQDFTTAIALDPTNSEAHDDLGVILARRKDYIGALKHFNAAIKHDPTYFKAYHNQAMVYYISGQDVLALGAVEQCLALAPDQRNSLLLKADILHAMGRDKEAAQIKDNAEFLPEGNWSERVTVQ